MDILEDYIEHHISPEPPELKEIDRRTNLYQINGRMCSGHIQGRLLKMLASMIKPTTVLELGTFTGYSALCVAEALDDDASVHTVEAEEELEDEIMRNLRVSPHGSKVTLHIGDAMKVMDEFEPESIDLGILDADKRLYPVHFNKMFALIKPGGYIIADNTLWDGHVTETTKHSAQTRGILEFNDMVVKRKDVEVAMIPVRDGLTIIRKLPILKR